MIQRSLQILKGLQHSKGLFMASKATVKTGYNRAWLRDNIYETLGLEAAGQRNEVVKAMRALLDVLLKHEYKIDWAIRQKPDAAYKYIHARYDPSTGNEIYEDWGNKQNDAIGAILFRVGELEEKGIKIIRGEDDLRILQKLVYYLESVEYWHDKDNGVWEENEELHASSVGACVAGLRKISKIVNIDKRLIEKGELTLRLLLPWESATKNVDMALLSLIYPFNVVSKEQAEQILSNVEQHLLRSKGIIRYPGDRYYSNGSEAEWCMGLPWLAICWKILGRIDKYAFYMRKTIEAMNEKGELPELYYANSDMHNENSPLGWAQSLFLVMMHSKA